MTPHPGLQSNTGNIYINYTRTFQFQNFSEIQNFHHFQVNSVSCSEAGYLAPVVPLLSQPVDQRALPEAAAVVWEAASTVPDPSVTGGRHLDDIKEYATFPLTCVKNKVVNYIFFVQACFFFAYFDMTLNT